MSWIKHANTAERMVMLLCVITAVGSLTMAILILFDVVVIA